MKTAISLILIAWSMTVLGQTAPAASDTLFVVTYTTGSSWDNSKPPGQQAFFKEHSENLGRLRQDGIIKLGARYADKGMIVISAASTAAAKELIFKDPGVVNHLFNADLQKFNLFYPGCVEKPKPK